MFDESFHGLRVDGAPSHDHLDLAALDTYRLADGEGFPRSYRAFIRQAGWGRTFGLWLIYPPVLPGFADGWQGRAGQLTSQLQIAYQDGEAEEFDWMIEPDGAWSQISTLQVFGWSENGDALLWDTSTRDSDGELTVWESRSMNSLHLLGPTLHEALSVVRDRTAGLFDTADHDVQPLPGVRL